MITPAEVSNEFRSLIERRRKHSTFLFSTAVAYGILADGVLHGRLPKPLMSEQGHILLAGTIALMLLSFLTAMREARLHKGIVCNGKLWRKLDMPPGAQPLHSNESRSQVFNPFGVSFCLFVIATLGGLALLALFCMVVPIGRVFSVALISATSLGLLGYFVRQHCAGASLARSRLASDNLAPVDVQARRNHISLSIDDAQRDMLELLAMTGLVTFFGFQLLAGLGDVQIATFGAVPFSTIQVSAPLWIAAYMIIVSMLAFISYVHLRLSIGRFSVILDPLDNAFRVLSFDDAFFGLVILLVPMSFDLFLLLSTILPGLASSARGLATVSFALMALAIERMLIARARSIQNGTRKPAIS